MTKTKLATQDHSKKCSLSSRFHKCTPAVIEVKIGIETRKLCQSHYNISIGKYDIHTPIFIKAINL